MTEIVLKIIIAVLCVFGITEVIHILKQKIITSKIMPETRLVVYLKGDTPDLQLAGIINEYNWYKSLKPKRIIAVYSDIDGDVLENCKKIAERNGVYLISSEKIKRKN